MKFVDFTTMAKYITGCETRTFPGKESKTCLRFNGCNKYTYSRLWDYKRILMQHFWVP